MASDPKHQAALKTRQAVLEIMLERASAMEGSNNYEKDYLRRRRIAVTQQAIKQT